MDTMYVLFGMYTIGQTDDYHKFGRPQVLISSLKSTDFQESKMVMEWWTTCIFISHPTQLTSAWNEHRSMTMIAYMLGFGPRIIIVQ